MSGINHERFGYMIPPEEVRCLSTYATSSEIVEGHPSDFRVAVYPDGRKVLQAGFRSHCLGVISMKWRDVPEVQVGADGQEVSGG